MPNIIPIRDLKDTSKVSELCSQSREPIFVTKNGYGNMVIMSMELYEEKMYMADVYAKLMAAEEQVKEGKTIAADDSVKSIREKYHV